MKITISFAEISDFISEHYDKQLSFERVSDKEVQAAYTQKILFRSVQVPLNLTFDEVKSDSVTVAYSARLGIDMIISGALSFLKAKVPELSGCLIAEDGHRIRIELAQLAQTRKLVEAVSLRDIRVDDNALVVEASLK